MTQDSSDNQDDDKRVRRMELWVKRLRPCLAGRCKLITAAAEAVAECGCGAAVEGQVARLVELQIAACDAFNKLRSLLGDWEAARGVEAPAFYVGDYQEAGDPPCATGCHCGQGRRPVQPARRPE